MTERVIVCLREPPCPSPAPVRVGPWRRTANGRCRNRRLRCTRCPTRVEESVRMDLQKGPLR